MQLNQIQTNLYRIPYRNPRLGITDIASIVEIAKTNDCLTFLDNTFMTPLHQRPLELGVDMVLHSATKFLSGHSDIVAGLAVTKDDELGKRLGFIQNSFGAVLGARDSYTLIQNIKTMGIRFEKFTEAAQKIVDYLVEHPLVKKYFIQITYSSWS